MSIQSLTPPQDITWTRMLFSRDMMDEKANDLRLYVMPPKWRSSFVVYHYIVPEEETVDAYPNSRIVYLKLSCSITGWNPSEELADSRTEAFEGGVPDDLQITLWEAIESSDWAEKYWPCLGAVMQIAIYPNKTESTNIEDYPYIMDFEPKKRELFESVSEGSEVLSGSSNSTSITKGSTNVSSLESTVSSSAGFQGFGVQASVKAGFQHTTVNQNVTDTSKEARETVSRTSTSSQMYQLFNGYHLGTNRSLFYLAPRPHTVSTGEQVEGSLINGIRKLEGIQEITLVVHMPKILEGFCVVASLDTGHLADPETKQEQLIITRRVAKGCGTFNENGLFIPKGVTEAPRMVAGEIAVDTISDHVMRMAPKDSTKKARVDAANDLNKLQSKISEKIVDKISAGNYEPRKFVETKLFKKFALDAIGGKSVDIKRFIDKNVISKAAGDQLIKKKITTTSELFTKKNGDSENLKLEELQESILNYLWNRK